MDEKREVDAGTSDELFEEQKSERSFVEFRVQLGIPG